MADWSAWTNPQAGLLGNPWQYIGDLGAGLLANSGPSFEPQGGFGSRLGRGMQYANAMQGERIMNDARRQEIMRSAKEQQGLSLFQNWMAANKDAPDDAKLAAAMEFVPELALKSWITNATDPLRLLQVQSADLSNQEKGAELAAAKVENQRIYGAGSRAKDAVAFLKTVPNGESVLVNAEWLPTLRKLKAGGWLDTELGGSIGEFLSKIPKDQWDNVLDAAEAVEKARSAIATSKSTQAGVVGLQETLKAQGGGAGLNLQEDLFGDAVNYAKEAATLSGWKLPEADTSQYPWRRGGTQQASGQANPYNDEGETWGENPAPAAGTVGVQNGRLVPQPPTQASGAPPVRKVPTQQLFKDPETGEDLQSYPRAVDGERAARAAGKKRFVAPHPETGQPWIYEVD